MNITHDEKREEDVEAVCYRIIYFSPKSTGDYGSGAECPFCYAPCFWDENDLHNTNHQQDCIYLIAKDLMTNK